MDAAAIEAWSGGGPLLGQGGNIGLWMGGVIALLFAFCFGACVGSFLNVVIYRLPAGMSIVSPPSRCPICGARLKWYDNLPVLGWLLLRGRCRYCDTRISPQYMVIELFMALLFVALTWVYFIAPPSMPYVSEIAERWWWWNGLRALPAFVAVCVMFAALLAMLMIDARTFTIPMQLPLVVIVVAFIAWPLQSMMPLRSVGPWPIPEVTPLWFWIAIGGMIGIVISLLLLRFGVFRYSFHDYDQYLPEIDEDAADAAQPDALREILLRLMFYAPVAIAAVAASFFTADPMIVGFAAAGGAIVSIMLSLAGGFGGRSAAGQEPAAVEALAPDYPHARREVLIEVLFLLPCITLMLAGFLMGRNAAGPLPLFWMAIGSSFLGYLVGGGLIWGIRILGTLGFGREAMGIGDVHLLAAVGAVMGFIDPIFIFFGAPFIALAWMFPTFFIKNLRSELPFGPYLAVATLVVLLLHPVLYGSYGNYWGYISSAAINAWNMLVP